MTLKINYLTILLSLGLAITILTPMTTFALDCGDKTTERAHEIMHDDYLGEYFNTQVLHGVVIAEKVIDNYELHQIETKKVLKGRVPAKFWVKHRLPDPNEDDTTADQCDSTGGLGEEGVFEVVRDYQTNVFSYGQFYSTDSEIGQFYLDHSVADRAEIEGDSDKIARLRSSISRLITQLKIVLHSISN
jgi:hypothetical protein